MLEWAKAKRTPGPGEWGAVRDAVQAAHGIEPDNPLFVEELGRLYEWRTRGLDPRQPVVRAFLARALEEFRTAARMRPASPTAWADIALVKFRLGALDSEFYAAAERAARLGPWEPGVQRVLAEFGLSGWNVLSPQGKALAVAAAERGLEMQPRVLEGMLKSAAQRAAFCADVPAYAPRTALACARIK
jgi:hypothetical protein